MGGLSLRFIKKHYKSKGATNNYIAMELSESLELNKKHLMEVFRDCDDIVYRKFIVSNKEDEGLLIYAKSLADSNSISENILKAILSYDFNHDERQKNNLESLEKAINVGGLKRVKDFQEILKAVLSGNTILLLNGNKQGLELSTDDGNERSIEESKVETVIRGPRDSFVENIKTNIGLVRRKIKSSNLKSKELIVGSESNTIVNVFYIDSIVNKEALNLVIKKIQAIKIDGIFESGYIEQYLEGNSYSPFSQVQFTERPDKVCGNLLDGKIIVMVDGSPQALIMPISFFSLFQSPEDYYERLLFGNFIRTLRFLGFIIATSLPAIYVALISFHHEMLPIDIMVDLSRSRAQIPFPPVVEAILMELTIELLREASARLPSTIGQTIGIVGAIVIGDAAIAANLVSPAMIIVVAITAIGSYVLPHYSNSYPLRIIRFPIIFMAANLGAFGIIIAWTWLITHLCSLESAGYPYLSPLAPLNENIKKDTILRGNLWNVVSRQSEVSKRNN